MIYLFRNHCQMGYVAKEEWRKVKTLANAILYTRSVFLTRGDSREAIKTIKEASELLKMGFNLVIFPEGTRSLNGEIGRFKRGAFQIAWDLGLPVIPLSLDGCYEVLPKGKPFVHRHPVHMHIGEPIDLKQFADPNEAIEAVRNAVINGKK
jgi:1-acyl-sn-glycerol-3-phosphate acyltransferase